MNLDELRPILDLMAAQEERYIEKFNQIHAAVQETVVEAKKHNGRMRALELKTHDLERDARVRSTSCNAKFTDMQPTIKTMKIVNAILKKPKTILFTSVGFMVVIEAIVVYAIEHQWLYQLITLLK